MKNLTWLLLILLTLHSSGRKIAINEEAIVAAEELSLTKGTEITLAKGNSSFGVFIRETPEDVLKLVRSKNPCTSRKNKANQIITPQAKILQ